MIATDALRCSLVGRHCGNSRRVFVPRSSAPVSVLLLALASTACGGKPEDTGPREILRQYGSHLEAERLKEAYALLSEDAKKSMPFEAFELIVRENPEEITTLVEGLRRPASPPRVTALVSTPSGEQLLMVYEAGAWRVDGSAIALYDQTSPRAAVRSFLRALKNARYDVLLRFVPDEKLEGLDAQTLEAAFTGEQKEEVERTAQALEAALPTAEIERTGDRATMSYGAGGTLQLVSQHGSWKIEDF
jgi:hypothetical protein